MTTAVAALAAVSLAVTVLGLARRPLVRRLAARHLAHRPSETALIVLGAMFGAATITAALVVGDSFDASLRDIARTNFGPLDVMVTVTPPADVSRELHHIEDVVAHAGLPHVDGMMTAVTAGATLTLPSANEPDATPKVLPRSCVAEIEFASARHFGPDRSIGGFAAAGSTPTTDAAAVNERTAARLGAGVGDEITVHAVGTSWSARIDRVLPTVGLAGYCDILVAPGTLQTRAGQTAGSATPATRVATPPTGALLISLDGGVINTDRYAKQVVRQLRALTRDDSKDLRLRTQVSAPKRDVIERATRTGDRLRTIFLGIGGFSIAAGILLLVNLVVMLAEERRRDLVKHVKKIAEEYRVSMRNHRRDANEMIDSLTSEGDVSEDDGDRAKKKVEEIHEVRADPVIVAGPVAWITDVRILIGSPRGELPVRHLG